VADLDLGRAAGHEHDTTALRSSAEALPLLAAWTGQDHAVLADLGYEGERAALTTPIVTHRSILARTASMGPPLPLSTQEASARRGPNWSGRQRATAIPDRLSANPGAPTADHRVRVYLDREARAELNGEY